jgi:hypothetical protein
MLYISGQNYQQKQTDYQNKKSFYVAEEALDSLKALLVSQAGEAYIAAYQDTMQNYVRLKSDEARKNYYYKAFLDKLVELWDEQKNESSDLVGCVRKYMTDNSVSYEVADCIYKVDSYGTTDDGQFVIKGVKSKYTEGNYTTFLYTDICVSAPNYTDTFTSSLSTSDDEEETEIDEKVSLTDCVIYMNWHKADYDE